MTSNNVPRKQRLWTRLTVAVCLAVVASISAVAGTSAAGTPCNPHRSSQNGTYQAGTVGSPSAYPTGVQS